MRTLNLENFLVSKEVTPSQKLAYNNWKCKFLTLDVSGARQQKSRGIFVHPYFGNFGGTGDVVQQ